MTIDESLKKLWRDKNQDKVKKWKERNKDKIRKRVEEIKKEEVRGGKNE